MSIKCSPDEKNSLGVLDHSGNPREFVLPSVIMSIDRHKYNRAKLRPPMFKLNM